MTTAKAELTKTMIEGSPVLQQIIADLLVTGFSVEIKDCGGLAIEHPHADRFLTLSSAVLIMRELKKDYMT